MAKPITKLLHFGYVKPDAEAEEKRSLITADEVTTTLTGLDVTGETPERQAELHALYEKHKADFNAHTKLFPKFTPEGFDLKWRSFSLNRIVEKQ